MQGTQRARFVEQLLSRAPNYASFVLVILMGFLLARLVWILFPDEPRPLFTANDGETVNTADQAQPNLGDTLASYHLFGVYQANSNEPAPVHIQNTQLAIKLQGVYAPPNGSGYAVIEENAQQKIYAVGDPIGNSDAVLEQIFHDHVRLRRNGLLEKLALPKPEASGGGGAIAAGFVDNPPLDMPPTDYTQPSPDLAPEMAAPPEMFTPNEGAIPPSEEELPELAAAESLPSLGEFRQAVMNNNMRLLEVASPQPYERDGKFLGFQLSPGSNVAMFNQLGLQPGDIVTAVNGTALENPAIAMRLLQEVATAPQVNLSITRNGQEVSLPINFQ